MKKILHSGPGILIGIPTLGRPVSLDWALQFKGMNPPINFNVIFAIIRNTEIGLARQAIAEEAVRTGVKYLFFLGDDVIPPAHAIRQLIFRIENRPNIGVVGGVYCSKCDPPAPLVFRGNGEGSYWDWKIGEFFKCSGLGMDCTLINTEVFKQIPKPWFKTVDSDDYLDGKNKAEAWTEDLFFCKRVLEETTYEIWCDGSIICEHEDIYGGRKYSLPQGSLPLRQLAIDKSKKCLIIGPPINLVDESYHITRCWEDEAADYRIDSSSLPFESNQFDWVIVTHPYQSVDDRFIEWMRVANNKVSFLLHPIINPESAASYFGGTIDGNYIEVLKNVNSQN